MDLIVILLTVLISYLAYRLYKIHRPDIHARLAHFPHPSQLPIIGTPIPGDSLNQTRAFMKHINEHKSPVVLKMLNEYVILLSSAKHVEAICSSSENISKGFGYHLINDWLGLGLLTSTGSQWHRQRKMLTPTFHYKILKDFCTIMNEQCAVMAELLAEKADSNEFFNICPSITMSTLDIICETSMGKKFQAQHYPDQPYIGAIDDFSSAVMDRFVSPWQWNDAIFKMTNAGAKYYGSLAILHDFTRKVIAERDEMRKQELEDQTDDEHKDEAFGSKRRLAFLDLLLDMKHQGLMSPTEVQEQVDTFMFEGHDTTATGIMWAIYCIARHKDIQDKIVQELDRVIGGKSAPDYNDLPELKYLDQCIKESQRLYPSVPQFGRRVTKDLKLDDQYTVPAGASVQVVVLALHQDPEVFPDPTKYDPERFSTENSSKRSPYAFVPFSAGPRNCIGQKFALMEMKVVLCHLLRNYSLICKQEAESMDPAMQFVLRPMNGVYVQLTKR